jgi:predicted transcriptional regulator
MIKDKKVTEQELKSIKEVQRKQGELVTSLGSLEYQLKLIEEEKEQVFKSLGEVEKEISDLTEKLKEKYGDVSIDIETGNLVTE